MNFKQTEFWIRRNLRGDKIDKIIELKTSYRERIGLLFNKSAEVDQTKLGTGDAATLPRRRYHVGAVHHRRLLHRVGCDGHRWGIVVRLDAVVSTDRLTKWLYWQWNGEFKWKVISYGSQIVYIYIYNIYIN